MAKVKCKYCEEKLEKQDASWIEVGKTKKVKHYYHDYCLKFKEDRDLALKKFYDYTGSLVVKQQVYLGFKQCRDMGVTDSDILYTIDYIIKNNCILNHPMGIKFYLDRAMKDKKQKELDNSRNERLITAPIKIMPLDMKKKKKKRDDSMDISDIL